VVCILTTGIRTVGFGALINVLYAKVGNIIIFLLRGYWIIILLSFNDTISSAEFSPYHELFQDIKIYFQISVHMRSERLEGRRTELTEM
jgi:hypothetical protein